MTSIRIWIIVLINSLVVLIVVLLSIFFYKEFKQALDERVLLQLTSIKRLKRVQIEEYINTEWKVFSDSISQLTSNELLPLNTEINFNSVDNSCLNSFFEVHQMKTGIYDLSDCSVDFQSKLAFVITDNENYHLKIISTSRIQSILLERTGMGNSGETYLVGEDYHLRSESRFSPNTMPRQIIAKTKGVIRALEGENGSEIIDDYRGVPVYSAYHKLEMQNLNWVILSEIDVEEVTVPFQTMKSKLILISALVLLFAIILSFIISTVLSKPLLKMRSFLNSMSKGKFDFETKNNYPAKEIREMFVALEKLKTSINEAIHFSTEIGEMNLNAKYHLSSEDDLLGKSLVLMQNKLTEYESAARNSRLAAKKSLIIGQENERGRLSRELHDGLGPLLTSLKLAIQSTELNAHEKRRVNTIVDDTIREIRRMTYDLMPSALVDFGVGKALANFVERIQKSSGINILYEDEIKETHSRVDIDMGVCIFRVCQELVNNSLKHSSAKKVIITLTEFDDKLSLYYVDNGKGFDQETVNRGLGLRNVEERVEVFNGYLNIISGSAGTIVEVEIPIEHE